MLHIQGINMGRNIFKHLESQLDVLQFLVSFTSSSRNFKRNKNNAVQHQDHRARSRSIGMCMCYPTILTLSRYLLLPSRLSPIVHSPLAPLQSIYALQATSPSLLKQVYPLSRLPLSVSSV